MFKNKDQAFTEDRPRNSGRALALGAAALFAVSPAFEARNASAQTAPTPAFTYDPAQNGQERVLTRFGRAPFAQSIEEALNPAHLEQVFTAAVQEGTLHASDRATFFAAAEAQRGQAGVTEEVAPGTVVPWMTYSQGRVAAAGPDRLRLNITQAAGARTFDVARRDGSTVTFGIVTRTVDGIPCFNVFPVDVTPPLTAPREAPPQNAVIFQEMPTEQERERCRILGLPCWVVGVGLLALVYVATQEDDDDDCCDPGDNQHPGDRRPWGDGDEVIESDPWN